MKKEENKLQKIYNLVIMDKSGSMYSIANYAIDGFNEVLNGVRKSAENFKDTQIQLMSLVLFDTESIDFVAWNEDPSKVHHLNSHTYVPCAGTPLYDAMGKALTKLRKEIGDDKDSSVVVTVITDGMENSSRDYSLSDIQALLNELKEKGWSFAYMGTDHDVMSVTHTLNITNVVQFCKSAEGTMSAFDKEMRARERYSRKWDLFRKMHPNACEEDIKNFNISSSMEYYNED